MRLLIGFMIVFAILMALQSIQRECSMITMTGVDWAQCLVSGHI